MAQAAIVWWSRSMSLPCYRRFAVFLLLGCLLLWNAPVMALPALLQQLAECERAAPAAPAAATSPLHAHHHHGMHHGAMPMPVSQRASAEACVTEHSCCSFNREPAQKSNAFSVPTASERQPSIGVTAGPATLRAAAPPNPSPLPERPVLERKTDLRI